MGRAVRRGDDCTTPVALSVLLAVVPCLLLVVASVMARASGFVPVWDVVADLTGFVLFAVVGAVIVRRQRANVVGWVMIGAGWCFALESAASRYVEAAAFGVDLPATVWVAWVASWVWSPAWSFTFGWLPLLFPDGRVLTPRWRWLAVVMGLGSLQVVPAMFLPVLEVGDDLLYGANPVGLSGRAAELLLVVDGAAALFVVVWVATIAMQVLRYRRADEVGRLQMRWFLFGVVLVIGTILLTIHPYLEAVLERLSFGLSVAFLPLAVGVAVTRYHLYDLGRLLSRSLAYVLVVVVLAAVYAGAVVGLGSVARAVTGEVGDLVVALSTLAVAALFQPVRRRVGEVVDRRFDRTRYDAARTVDDFGRRLRSELGLEHVVADLHSVAVGAVQPQVAAVLLLSDASTARTHA